MKKSIFLFFAAILCAMTANALNQPAKDLYFDNSEAKWSSCYVYIGHGTWTSCYAMSRVSGTQYLWQLPANFNSGNSWDGASGWVLCNEKWWDSQGESVDKYTWHGDNNVTQKSTSAWVDTKIYKTNGTASTKSDNHTINAYKVTSYTKSNYTVTINTVEGGTLTVKDYDDNAVATGASKIHLTVLKFSATPASGYVLDGVQINDGSTTTTIAAANLATTTHTLTKAVTITPVWKATTSTVTVTATATNGTVTGGGVVEEGTSVTLTATAATGYQFKNWTVAGTEVSTANPYTFTANEDVTVVANFEETPKVTVYFVNNSGWTKIQAYAWEGTKGANPGWPGADITANKLGEQIGGFDVYSYTVEQGSYGKVIFNNGSAQTKDYVWTDGNYYWNNEPEGFVGGSKVDAETKFSVPVEYDYVYFINTNDWAKAYIYTWTPEVAGWPGAEMTKEAEKIAGKDVYSYKVVKGTTFGGMNFNCGGDECKTGDLTWSAGKYYAPSKDKWYDDAVAAEAGLAAPEPEPTELTYNVTVPEGTNTCYIAMDTDPAQDGWEFTEMTKVDDTHYTITITGAKKANTYKYASGPEWGYVEKDASGNEIGDRTWAEADVVAKWAAVYDPDAVEQELTYSVTVPEGTYACYIAMDTDPAQDGWEFNEMTKVDDTHYTFTRTGLKNKTYKYASGAGWEYVEKTAEDGEVADRTWAEADVVAKWASVYNPSAPTYDYYLTGSLVGGWEPKQQGIEKDGELYKATFNALAAGTYEFKITAGDWEHQWNYNNLGAAYEEVSQGVDGEGNPNGNIKIVTEEAKNITVIFDGSKITFEGLTEKAPAVVTYVLMGVNSDWTTGIALTQNPVNDKEYMLTCQAISATDAIKVVRLEDGVATAWYGSVKDGVEVTVNYDGSGNIQLPAGTYNFYFDSSLDDKQLWIAAATDCEPTPVAIRENLTVGQWGTLCPTQNVDNPTGATFYQIAYLEEKDNLPFNMHFNEVTTGTLQAGQPYFFIASATEIKGVKSGEVKTAGDNVNGFYGYIGAEAWTLPYQESFDVNNNNTFVIWNNSVFRINAATSIKSERCYININLTEPIRTSTPAPVGARRITMGVSGINGQNTATGMENVDASAQPVKTIINGQLFILRGEKMYDAQGKLVK